MSRSGSDVTAVTVNWNGREHLRHLLPSLQESGCQEIIVVDNGSSDGSQDFVRRHHPQVRLLANPENLGFCQPNNAAARIARGRYLAFINNDMRVDPAWLEAATARLQGKVRCVGCRILDWEGRKVDFNGASLQYLGFALQLDVGRAPEDVVARERILFPCGGAMLVDRETFLAAGGFDEDFFAIFEDVDLGWRLWLLGYEVAFASDSIVYHRGHATFRSQAEEKMRYLMHRNALLTIFKNYEEATFRKVLPVALLLAVRRAVLCSGADKNSFYLWGKTRERVALGDPSASTQLLDSLNHLVALDDVLEFLPEILKKRSAIQAQRVRSDSELRELFEEPLRTIVEDVGYLRYERDLLDRLDLSALLDGSATGKLFEDLPGHLKADIDSLKRELRHWRRVEGCLLLHPSSPPGRWRRRLGAILRRWRLGKGMRSSSDA